MSEQAGQDPQETSNYSEIQRKEIVTDPKRLAEIVLNTLDETFNYDALQIDDKAITELMENPHQNWNSIVKIVTTAAANAATLEPQIQEMDEILMLVADFPEEGLHVTQAGDPPKTILDPRGIDQLTVKKNTERKQQEQQEKKGLTTAQKVEYDTNQRAKYEEAIQSDEVRRLALLIAKCQDNSVKQKLTLVRTYGELIGESDTTRFTPSQLHSYVGRVVSGVNDARKYTQYERIALQQYCQGNLPTKEVAMEVAKGGTKAYSAYLETFASPASSAPSSPSPKS